jgi:hypothetical protein
MASFNPVSRATDAVRGHVLVNANVGDAIAALLAATVMWVLITIIPDGFRRRRIVADTTTSQAPLEP